MGNHSSSQKKWQELLAETKVSQLLKARSKPLPQVVKISSKDDLKTALSLLAESNILAAPVYSGPIDADVRGHPLTLHLASSTSLPALVPSCRNLRTLIFHEA